MADRLTNAALARGDERAREMGLRAIASVMPCPRIGWRAHWDVMFPEGCSADGRNNVMCSGYGKTPREAIQNLFNATLKSFGGAGG